MPYYTIAFGWPMWPSPCSLLSWECGHIGHVGHNKYSYFHEALRWPHGLQWALIFAWASWMTTRAATGIWNCTSLLHGHMGHNCYKIDKKMRWPHGLYLYRGREQTLYGHMGHTHEWRLDTILYHPIRMTHVAEPIWPILVAVWPHRPH